MRRAEERKKQEELENQWKQKRIQLQDEEATIAQEREVNSCALFHACEREVPYAVFCSAPVVFHRVFVYLFQAIVCFMCF